MRQRTTKPHPPNQTGVAGLLSNLHSEATGTSPVGFFHLNLRIRLPDRASRLPDRTHHFQPPCRPSARALGVQTLASSLMHATTPLSRLRTAPAWAESSCRF